MSTQRHFPARDPDRKCRVPAVFGFVPRRSGTIPGGRPLMSLSFPAVSPCPRVPRAVECQRTAHRPDEPNQRSAPMSRKTPTLCLQGKRHRQADGRGHGTTCHCLRDSRGDMGTRGHFRITLPNQWFADGFCPQPTGDMPGTGPHFAVPAPRCPGFWPDLSRFERIMSVGIRNA